MKHVYEQLKIFFRLNLYIKIFDELISGILFLHIFKKSSDDLFIYSYLQWFGVMEEKSLRHGLLAYTTEISYKW